MTLIISKQVITDSGIITNSHVVTNISTDRELENLIVSIDSWTSEANRLAGQIPVFKKTYTIPTASVTLATNLKASIKDSLLGTYGLSSGSFISDTNVSLEILKDRKNTEINLARMRANRSVFQFNGKDISCDELSRSDIDGVNGIVSLTGELPSSWPGAWKAVDNTYVTIANLETWVSFYAAMVAKGTENFAKAQTLKALLASATTEAEIDAITW